MMNKVAKYTFAIRCYTHIKGGKCIVSFGRNGGPRVVSLLAASADTLIRLQRQKETSEKIVLKLFLYVFQNRKKFVYNMHTQCYTSTKSFSKALSNRQAAPTTTTTETTETSDTTDSTDTSDSTATSDTTESTDTSETTQTSSETSDTTSETTESTDTSDTTQSTQTTDTTESTDASDSTDSTATSDTTQTSETSESSTARAEPEGPISYQWSPW